MKRKISDILDVYQDNSVTLENGTPLSPQQIKELTMKKMKVRRNPVRFGIWLVAVAAIISLLAVTASARKTRQAGSGHSLGRMQ